MFCSMILRQAASLCKVRIYKQGIVMSCSLAESTDDMEEHNARFLLWLLFGPEYGGDTLPQNVDGHLPSYSQ
jgi:hypothetical protein